MVHEKLTVRNCGEIEIYNSIIKQKGYKKLNEFLSELSKNLIKRTALYIREVDARPPYSYSEKSFHTILTPSIDSITNRYLIENPIRRIAKAKRNKPGKDGHGWVDYWIGYDNIEIFLELKQGWIATKTNDSSTLKQIQDTLWSSMNKQLDELEDDAKYYQVAMKKSQTFFRVGMMILPFYQWCKNEKDIMKDKSKFEKIHEEISTKITPIPNWTGLFWMHNSLQDDLIKYQQDGRFCYRPGFMILLNVKEIHKV